jgi:membrane protein YdbS with pleckstrin-like domain
MMRMSGDKRVSEQHETVPTDAAPTDAAPTDAAPTDAAPSVAGLVPATATDAHPLNRLDLPGAGEWKRVSPKYLVVELVGTVLFGLIACAVALALWLGLGQQWAAYPGAVIAVITIVTLVLEPRRVRSIGYQMRQDDLLFRRGIMFQRFVSVPYGRMQLVDITRGPVARWLGLADLKFVTAAASTGVSIPGLPEADADALRDRLVELAESRRAGL